jgi:hypothetical protein
MCLTETGLVDCGSGWEKVVGYFAVIRLFIMVLIRVSGVVKTLGLFFGLYLLAILQTVLELVSYTSQAA